MEYQQLCQTPGCEKIASLQCPICQKMELDPQFFCTQECFKAFFPIHKFMHKKREETTDTYKYTGPLRPGKVAPRVVVPEDIPKPDWAYTGFPKEEQESKMQRTIPVYDKDQIEQIRKVCLLGRQALDLAHANVKAGVTTDEVNQKVHQFHMENKAYPSPLNYHKFPKSCCTSVNEVICHGIPDSRPLENGDICNVDISTFKYGFHADLNETFAVGEIPESSKFLIEKTYRSLELAISMCKPGTMYRDLGNAIGKYVEDHGLSVVRTYTGHGVGKLFHCAPNIPHYKHNKATGFMKEGHVFTIEPMINQGTYKDVTWNDDWTAVTADGQRSAQFEHTILVTASGCEVLTQRLETSPKLCFDI